MMAFGAAGFDDRSIYVQAGADIILLAAISTPFIFALVINPFVRDRDKALKQLRYLAQTDPLTKLPNRRSIFIEMEKFIAGATRHRYFGAALLLDLDGFKEINDQHGHDAGDHVLVEVANRLRSRVRLDEVVGRLGGDEFILLISNLDIDQQQASDKVLMVANQLIGLLSEPVNYHNKQLKVGVSIGVRIFGSEDVRTGDVMKDADTAMYNAKKSGKGRCVIFDG
jgi:diguanylate cyclase (GGDEF)-like protein